MFQFHYNERTGLLRASAHGFWSIETADRYCDAMQRETRRARKAAGRLRLLVDVSDHGVQPPEVMERLRRAREVALLAPGDRVAILVSAGLAGAQTKRVIKKHGGEVTHDGEYQIFEDVGAALAWLGIEVPKATSKTRSAA